MIRNVKHAKNVAQIHTQYEMSPCSVTAKKGEKSSSAISQIVYFKLTQNSAIGASIYFLKS